MSQYSAVCAKVRAMYGKRLTLADYDALLAKRTIPEIASYLKATPGYEEVLNGINEHMLHRGQLEELLERDIIHQTIRLHGFIAGPSRQILAIVLLRHEKDNLLAYIRHLLSKAETTFFFSQNEFVNTHSRLPLEQLTTGLTIQEVAAILQSTPYGPPLAHIVSTGKATNYPYIEKVFTEFFFERVAMLVTEAVPKNQLKFFLSFFLAEKDFLNLQRLFRLKLYYPEMSVNEHLLSQGPRLSSALLEELSACSLEELQHRVTELYYGKYFASGRALDDAFFHFSFDICRKILHGATNESAAIPAYLHLKQLEIHNLTLIIEGVRYGRSAEQIKSRIIGYTGGVESGY